MFAKSVRMRSQSAMEYLMTYGWAILIIAVVLGGLYSLGLFNGLSLTPKIAPGSCQVYRPNGPMSTQYISLEGACINQVPQYVAQFGGPSKIGQIFASMTNFPVGSSARSEFAWIYYTGNNPHWVINVYGGTTGGSCTYNGVSGLLVGSSNQNLYFVGCNDDYSSAFVVTPNVWHFVGYTYSAGATSVTLYLDGKSLTGGISYPLNTQQGTFDIGNFSGFTNYWAPFQGMMSDVQLYNASLDSTQANAIYQSGIGAVPVSLQNLVGWWPLNGNTNDYSGNLNNGAPVYNVIYTGQWQNGYIAP